jgi:hypothetical protein
MFLIPAPGVVVIDPVTRKPLAPEGRELSMTSFWLRRLAEGSVIEGLVAAPAEVVQPDTQIHDSTEST